MDLTIKFEYSSITEGGADRTPMLPGLGTLRTALHGVFTHSVCGALTSVDHSRLSDTLNMV
jgi:hypothetical protein